MICAEAEGRQPTWESVKAIQVCSNDFLGRGGFENVKEHGNLLLIMYLFWVLWEQKETEGSSLKFLKYLSSKVIQRRNIR